MSMGQVQIIQSLAQALTWYEKEIAWNCNPSELNHLVGRIGELYAAMITGGVPAIQTNQKGFDIVDGDNQKTSVKTVTTSTHVSFNPNTLNEIKRFMVFRVAVTDDKGLHIETIADFSDENFVRRTTLHADGKHRFMIPKLKTAQDDNDAQSFEVVEQAKMSDYLIKRHANQSITVWRDENQMRPAKPVLRKLARELGIDLFLTSGGQKNTRHLGAQIIREINSD